MNRDLDDYLFHFNQLPFERTQERFRKRKMLELLSHHKHQVGKLLEVGPGLNPLFPMTRTSESGVVLEPISEIYDQLKHLYMENSKFEILNHRLEDYIAENPKNKFDTVILSSVLHEIPNPENMLELIYKILEVEGTLFVVVPNNQSLHRLIGEKMGKIKSLTELTDTEKLMQQSTSYSPQHLVNQLKSHGFEIKEVITSFIKPLPHAKMQEAIEESFISEEDLNFLYKISSQLPDFGSEIFGIATK